MLTKTTLFLLATFTVCFSFAQTDTAYSYLRVYFDKANTGNRNFLQLAAEPGNKYAEELYALKKVRIIEPEVEDPIFYVAPDKQKVDSIIFTKGNNAFKTVTEGLNFLAEKDWQLYLVENNTYSNGSSAYAFNNIVYLPGISSTPVYIFRKKITSL